MEYTLLRPHGSNSPAARFYGLPKIQKSNMPMCPIVSDCGTATYNTAKFITKIFKITVARLHSLLKIVHISSRKLDSLKNLKSVLPSSAYQYLLHYKLSIPKFLPAPVSPMSTRSLKKNSSIFWNSLSPTASFSSISSINNYRVQPWVHLSALSLQISIWNAFNP